MKLKTLAILIISSQVFFSCNSEQEDAITPESKLEESIIASPDEDEIDTSELETDDKTSEGILQAYLRERAELKKKLKSCTPQYANQLYMDYRKQIEVTSGKLTGLESKMLDDYEGLYDDDGWLKLSGKYGTKIKNYQINGFEFWYVGEGMSELRVRPSEVSNLFYGRVTSDFQEFIEMEETENRELLVNDGGLSVSFDRLATIVRQKEIFLNRNPKSALKKEVKEMYERYQMWYLFGLDNTPAVEYSDGMIYEENKASFARYMDFNPDSPTAKLIKLLLALEGNYEVMRKQIDQTQEKLLQKM